MSVKGLHKIIYPFAPDQSGAAAVLYELGGMIIICDAGGCAGNVCGFDEPRWLSTKSAVFSAGLRDMDAIMGRDDLMIDKIVRAAARIDARFIAIIGTPVPATIATDYKALRRMAEKRIGLPVLTVDANGIRWYDSGIEKAYLELFRTFTDMKPDMRLEQQSSDAAGCGRDGQSGRAAGVQPGAKLQQARLIGASDAVNRRRELQLLRSSVGDCDPPLMVENGTRRLRGGGHPASVIPGSAGVIGVTPLDTGSISAGERIREIYREQGYSETICYGAGCTLGDLTLAGQMEKNVVITPAGIRAAEYLKEKYGTPYECTDPLIMDVRAALDVSACDLAGRRILIIHQQIRANALRDVLLRELHEAGKSAEIDCASWFMMESRLAEPGDIRIREERDFTELMQSGRYDVIIADRVMQKAAGDFGGQFIDLPHFAVSGRAEL